ncbi:MAG: HAD-IB family hydrolase [Gammaproteobacteria bacterium]|nr:HAD-IB family hydrolase [Gammaproteobacteria bacterium]
MKLAIFDLDNTLLAGDSDYLWGEFLVEQGLVNGEAYRRENDRFYEEYKAGTLDIYEFLAFSLKPLSEHDINYLRRLHRQFMDEKIKPIMLPAAFALIQKHKDADTTPIIITATNRFVTEPIASAFGVDTIIATEPEFLNNRYTGKVAGTPCFRQGKVERLNQWLQQAGLNLKESWFYSDSHNDIPLLSLVSHPVAVDPDQSLKQHAQQHGWEIISLRS